MRATCCITRVRTIVEKVRFAEHLLQEPVMDSNWPLEFPGVNWLDEAERRAVLDVVEKGMRMKLWYEFIYKVAAAVFRETDEGN